MAQSGIALTPEQIIEILSMYSSSAERVDAVAVAPGWTVIGGFPMPQTATIRISALGSVSDVALTMSFRLYRTDVGFAGVVAGSSVVITSLTDVENFSSLFELPRGQYQVQCQVVGAAGVTYFGNARRVAPGT
jgi:hypothetical protein